MKYLSLFLAIILSGCAGQYAFEKGKFKQGETCPEMVGTWFTDVTVQNTHGGKKRDITRLERNSNGTAYLRGTSIYLDTNEVNNWEFPSQWSCDGEWYIESNEWGYTSFKIVKLGKDENILFDKKNNLNAPKPIKLIERKTLNGADRLRSVPSIKAHLNL